MMFLFLNKMMNFKATADLSILEPRFLSMLPLGVWLATPWMSGQLIRPTMPDFLKIHLEKKCFITNITPWLCQRSHPCPCIVN